MAYTVKMAEPVKTASMVINVTVKQDIERNTVLEVK